MRAKLLSMVAIALVVTDVSAAVAACLKPDEARAFQIRSLQTELMVATLTCRTVPNRDYRTAYSVFVDRHQKSLAGHASVFQGFFKRAFGGDATRQQDIFVTSLANDASTRSLRSDSYCEDIAALFDKVHAADAKALPEVASVVPIVNPIGPSCGPDGNSVRTAAKP